MNNLTPEQWDAKIIELGGSILQSWVWGEFQKSLGYEIHRLSSDSFAALVVMLPMPMNKKYAYCPKGPLGDLKDAQKAIEKLSEDHSVVFARMEPNQAMNLPKALKETQPTHNWLVDLEPDEQKLLINMKPKHRYNINLAERKGVIIREGGQADLLALWKLLMETATRNKFRLHPQNYYWQAWDHLNPDHMKILLAEHEGKPLAGMILTFFGGTSTYLHGGSASVMKEAMAPYLLHWQAMKISRSLGMKFYDFGGIAPINEPAHSWVGISRFKKGFGGFELVTPGSYDLVFSPLWYNVYKQARLMRKLLR